jgi:hypothetical protein
MSFDCVKLVCAGVCNWNKVLCMLHIVIDSMADNLLAAEYIHWLIKGPASTALYQ